MIERVLWLVAARSGSKGLPHKNIRPLGGVPLLAWRVLCARRAGGQVWVSTDSEDYASVARQYGAHTPFVRPADLSSDTARSESVCLHAMQFAENLGQSFDYIGLLQPTSPFVSPQSLVQGLAKLAAHAEAPAVVAVREVSTNSLFIQPHAPYLNVLAQNLAQRSATRRQDAGLEITPCGGFYLARWKDFLKNPTFYTEKTMPHLVSPVESLDIDTELDFAYAEFLLASGRVDIDVRHALGDSFQAVQSAHDLQAPS